MPTVKRKSMDTLCHAFFCMLHGITCERYDVIQLHALASGMFSFLGRLGGIPTVTKIHGLDWQRAKWKGLGCMVLRHAERSLVMHSSDVIVVSKALQSYFAQKYGLDTVYIPNGVEQSDSTAVLDRGVLDEFQLSPGRFIAYIGRLVPEKRIEDLIIAFGRVTTPYKLVIVGEAGYTDNYVNHLRCLAATDARVVFTGLQKGAALQTLYRAAAVFVLPSDLEGLPNSLLECMEHATPAIVSDIAPHRELLGSITGYDLFVAPRDVEGLTERLVRVLHCSERYAEVAVQAQTFVRRCYSWENSADLTEEVLYRAANVPYVRPGGDKQLLSTDISRTLVRR
jgi:glycosyltransferase involved in cell wall biosynthesis